MRCAALQLLLISLSPALVRSVALKDGFTGGVASAIAEETGGKCDCRRTGSGLGKLINRACTSTGRLFRRGRGSFFAKNNTIAPKVAEKRAGLLSVRIHKTTLEVFSRHDGYRNQGSDYQDELVLIPEELISADGNTITADNLKRAIQQERNILWQARAEDERHTRDEDAAYPPRVMDVDVSGMDMRNFELARFELTEKQREQWSARRGLQHELQRLQNYAMPGGAVALQSFYAGGVVPQEATDYYNGIIDRAERIAQQLAEIAADRLDGEVLSGDQVINLDTLSDYAFEYSPSRELNNILNKRLTQATCAPEFVDEYFASSPYYGNRAGRVSGSPEPEAFGEVHGSPEPEAFGEDAALWSPGGSIPRSTTLLGLKGSPLRRANPATKDHLSENGEPGSPEPEAFGEVSKQLDAAFWGIPRSTTLLSHLVGQGYVPQPATLEHRGGSPSCVAAADVLLQPKDEAGELRAVERTSPFRMSRRLLTGGVVAPGF